MSAWVEYLTPHIFLVRMNVCADTCILIYTQYKMLRNFSLITILNYKLRQNVALNIVGMGPLASIQALPPVRISLQL